MLAKGMWKEEITLGRMEERQKQSQVGGGGGGKAVNVQHQSWVGPGTSSPPQSSCHCPKAARVPEEFGQCSQVCCAGPGAGFTDPIPVDPF